MFENEMAKMQRPNGKIDLHSSQLLPFDICQQSNYTTTINTLTEQYSIEGLFCVQHQAKIYCLN